MYTLVGQKCGTVLLDPRTTGVVNSEAVSRQSTITDNPVEGGGNIQDHVFCQPLTIQLQGTAINGADTIAALSAMWKKGDILTYTGRNRISNLVIQNLQSTHDPSNRNGFTFSATLKQITIGSSEDSGTASTMSVQDSTAAASSPTPAKSSLPASQTTKTKSDGLKTTATTVNRRAARGQQPAPLRATAEGGNGMQLIELGSEVQYIEIDTSKVPYTFSVKLEDRTYSFTIRYNDVGGFFTADLSISATGEVLAYGDPIRYGRPMFGPIEDERFPLPVIIPLCLTGDDIDAVTWDNLGKEVQLYLFERRDGS